ncbi:serine/threonine-protein kinase PCRK1-like [Bidens hawaiensis]|uniref:serine/threonine-protein kinase PCRK1-like n=1 Tax=Bidens hawaiensis TaxID=980011 RepID=UPI00404B7A58
MVFHCRCFSIGDEQIEYETRTQTKSTTTGTFHTADPDFDIQTSTLQVPHLAEKRRNLRVFTLAELEEATENFCTDSKIGEGYYGSLYKGVVKSLEHPFDEIQVAVKVADGLSEEGHRWRVIEIKVIGVAEHPNLVKLIGYCVSGTRMCFVYEYMASRSMRDCLSAHSETPLAWNTRLKVAQDAACVLTYIHKEMMSIKNFKSSNVLIDDQWNAKLSDFGVPHILAPDGRRVTHISTKIAGFVQYAPPEYVSIGHFASKCDVWCYGIFLYELITGRHPLELITGRHGSDWIQPLNEHMLLEWVKPYLGSKRFHKIVDPRLEGNYPLESTRKLCVIANKCLSDNPKSRPKMSEVLEMVNQLITVPSQAKSSTSTQVPHVAVDPNKAYVGSSQGEKTNEDIELKRPGCLPHICPRKLLKPCSKKGSLQKN